MTPTPPARKFAILAALLLGGAVFDFFLNGILRIGTAWVYVPADLAMTFTISDWLRRGRYEQLFASGALVFFAGALAGHFAFVDRATTVTYPMHVIATSPITLGSDDYPQTLVVMSDKLPAALTGHADRELLPVMVNLTTDYGCVRNSAVATVAGIDVLVDKNATWTWKLDKKARATEEGPGNEDRHLIWCRR